MSATAVYLLAAIGFYLEDDDSKQPRWERALYAALWPLGVAVMVWVVSLAFLMEGPKAVRRPPSA